MTKIGFLILAIQISLTGCQLPAPMDIWATEVASATSSLAITFAKDDSPESVTQNLSLPTTWGNDVTVSWNSSSTSVITNAGLVNRPEPGHFDAPVILTATLTKNHASGTKTFLIIVKGLASVNVAKGKPAMSDSEQLDNPVKNGNDGDYQTRWCAIDGEHNHWYVLDLQSITHVTLSKLYWEWSGNYQYQIFGSNDKRHWALIVDRSKSLEWASLTIDSISANYQYFKIIIVGALKHKPEPENTWDSFYEWELY